MEEEMRCGKNIITHSLFQLQNFVAFIYYFM